jgi:hypothetical protein
MVARIALLPTGILQSIFRFGGSDLFGKSCHEASTQVSDTDHSQGVLAATIGQVIDVSRSGIIERGAPAPISDAQHQQPGAKYANWSPSPYLRATPTMREDL